MSISTLIEENTLYSATGCTKISPGCKHRYAEVAARRLKLMGVGGFNNGSHP